VIGSAIGFFILGVYGLIPGAAVGLLFWPAVRRVAWFLATLYGGQSEPEQEVHFWVHKRKRCSGENEKPSNSILPDNSGKG
jgi:hypothetical protein